MYPPNKLGGITAPLALPHFPKKIPCSRACLTNTSPVTGAFSIETGSRRADHEGPAPRTRPVGTRILRPTEGSGPEGGVVMGTLADYIDRRYAMMINILVYSLSTGLIFFAHSLSTILVLRFFTGLGLGGEWGLGMTLVAGRILDRLRGRTVAFANIGWPCGTLLAAVFAYFINPALCWRATFALAAFPAVLALWIRACVPESDLWKNVRQVERELRRHPLLRSWASSARGTSGTLCRSSWPSSAPSSAMVQTVLSAKRTRARSTKASAESRRLCSTPSPGMRTRPGPPAYASTSGPSAAPCSAATWWTSLQAPRRADSGASASDRR